MLQIFRVIIYLLFITTLLIFNGCAASYKGTPIFGEFIIDSNTVQIPIEEFETLKSHDYFDYCYSGFGQLTRCGRMSRGIYNIEHTFTKVLYNPKDSLLYIEGKLYQEGEPYKKGQIIMGILPEIKEGQYPNEKIDIYYNYLVHEDGEFKATLALWSNLKLSMIIAPREDYTKNGDFKGTPLTPITVYEVYKILEKYKSK